MTLIENLKNFVSDRTAAATRTYRSILLREAEKPGDIKSLADVSATLELNPAAIEADRVALEHAARLRASIPSNADEQNVIRAFKARQASRDGESADCRARRRMLMAQFREAIQREGELSRESEKDRDAFHATQRTSARARAELAALVLNHPRVLKDES